jgi:hypothetical protein
MIGSGRRGFCQVLAPELRNRNYEPQGKAGKGENGVLPEMKLTGAICQTNEAPTAGILGYHSHRSPAIWNRPFPQPLVARKAQGRITDSLTISTSHRSDAKGNDPTKASSMFNIGSVSTQFTLWSLFILPIWYTPGAAPHTPTPFVPAVTHFKSLSQCRSLRAPGQFYRFAQGSNPFEHLRLPSHAFEPTQP